MSGPAVEVDGRTIGATDVIVATGSRPRMLPGLEVGEHIITSDQALWFDRIPASAVVIGAGAVGLEFASMYRSFGADVTVLEALPVLAPLEDDEVSKEIARAYRKRGITTAAGASVQAVKDTGEGVEVTYEAAGKAASVAAEICLVAVGRGPVTDGLGLEEAGVSMHEKGFVNVDAQLRTNVEHVWAVGDVADTPLQLAHVSFDEGYAVAERIAGEDVPDIDYVNIPKVTYCTPEIASVGLTEAQAKERGMDVAVEKLDFRAIGKANIVGEGGFVKVVAEADGGPVRRDPHDRPTRHRPDRRGHADHELGGHRRRGGRHAPPASVPVRSRRRGHARARRQAAALPVRSDRVHRGRTRHRPDRRAQPGPCPTSVCRRCCTC